MANLTTTFFGLSLNSPIVAASSSLTGKIDHIREFAAAGAGAVVLKSIFEEEIYEILQEELNSSSGFFDNQEQQDYFDYVIRNLNVKKYVELITEAKKAIHIPVVASISCVSSGDWVQYIKRIEEAGADALELNMFLTPSDENRSSEQQEKFYFETIEKIRQKTKIPVSIKISHYFSNLAQITKRLSETGIAGITLFNRFYVPDVDIDKQELTVADVLSKPDEYLLPLRWTAILSGKVNCPLAATTGIHSSETAIKLLLAGASALQVASVLYREGPNAIAQMNEGISRWMDAKGYKTIDEFKGLVSLGHLRHATSFERFQFMKYFGEKEF